jgi:hypothetical protein
VKGEEMKPTETRSKERKCSEQKASEPGGNKAKRKPVKGEKRTGPESQ